MRKKFAITLICMTTIVYGSILYISSVNNTNFFQEINHQLIRLQGILKYSQQVTYAKEILKTVAVNEIPPENWRTFLEDGLHEYSDKAFFFFKIWLVESKISIDDIDDSYLIFIATNSEKLVLDMRFPGHGQILQFNIYQDSKKKLLTGLFLPISNRNFSADYNNDGLIDQVDLIMSRDHIQKSGG